MTQDHLEMQINCSKNCVCVCVCSYQGPLLEDGALETAVIAGAESPEFTKLCAWLGSELKLYCKLEENVQATNLWVWSHTHNIIYETKNVSVSLGVACAGPSEAEGFQLEMSGL